MKNGVILETGPLGFPWATIDPFLFCAYHLDHYPKGNDRMGPATSLEGRRIGMDFEIRDGFRMYHGDVVPGFPQHPHRGFETITIARQGFIDHSDSLGATARFGAGDVQWMTAGAGIVHSEMFPLIKSDADNPTELFQIWLNLPASDKMVDPYFTMFWSETLPRHTVVNARGAKAEVLIVAGAGFGEQPPKPPPNSRASQPNSDVAVWSITLQESATVTLPRAAEGSHRALYFFAGQRLSVSGQEVSKHAVMAVDPSTDIELESLGGTCEILMLQGRPLNEPVVQHGPFVMNTSAEIQQAMLDYRKTGFGGWPWPGSGPVHSRERGRFAKHADGKLEEK